MAQEAAEGQPAIGLDHLDSRRGGRADGPRPPRASSAVAALSKAEAPAPITATRLPRSAFEVDRLATVCDANVRGRCASCSGIHPVADALLPRRQHDLARVERLDGVSDAAPCAASRPFGRRAQSPSTRTPLRTGKPIVRRTQSRYSAQCSRAIRPSRCQISVAEARLVPGLVGQARDVEVRPGVILRAAQGRHAGIGQPRALPSPPRPCRARRMLLTRERSRPKADGDAGLAGADDRAHPAQACRPVRSSASSQAAPGCAIRARSA